jgi:hypothetical protein
MSRTTARKARKEQEAKNRLHNKYASWVNSSISEGLTREETVKLVRDIVVNPTDEEGKDGQIKSEQSKEK